MDSLKTYFFAIVSLAVMIIVLNQLLKFGKKAPIIGGAVEKVEDLVQGD